MLVAEELFLLLLDDASGRPYIGEAKFDTVLAGAIVLELTQRRRLDLSGQGETVKPGRLVVRDISPTGDASLDRVLGRLAERRSEKPPDAIAGLSEQMHRVVLLRLCERGVLRQDSRRILRIFPTTRWPTVDPRPEQAVREALREVLIDRRAPEAREVGLISLLLAVDLVPPVLPIGEDISVAELRRRSATIAAGEFVGETVREMVRPESAGDTPWMTTPFTPGSSQS